MIFARGRQALNGSTVRNKLDLRAVVAICWNCDSGRGRWRECLGIVVCAEPSRLVAGGLRLGGCGRGFAFAFGERRFWNTNPHPDGCNALLRPIHASAPAFGSPPTPCVAAGRAGNAWETVGGAFA